MNQPLSEFNHCIKHGAATQRKTFIMASPLATSLTYAECLYRAAHHLCMHSMLMPSRSIPVDTFNLTSFLRLARTWADADNAFSGAETSEEFRAWAHLMRAFSLFDSPPDNECLMGPGQLLQCISESNQADSVCVRFVLSMDFSTVIENGVGPVHKLSELDAQFPCILVILDEDKNPVSFSVYIPSIPLEESGLYAPRIEPDDDADENEDADEDEDDASEDNNSRPLPRKKVPPQKPAALIARDAAHKTAAVKKKIPVKR